MTGLFNSLAKRMGDFYKSLFAERIDGKGINLSPGSRFISTLRLGVHENPARGTWDVVAIHTHISRQSTRHHFAQSLLIAPFPTKEAALETMHKMEPRLEQLAPGLLTRMGVREPAIIYPVLAEKHSAQPQNRP